MASQATTIPQIMHRYGRSRLKESTFSSEPRQGIFLCKKKASKTFNLDCITAGRNLILSKHYNFLIQCSTTFNLYAEKYQQFHDYSASKICLKTRNDKSEG